MPGAREADVRFATLARSQKYLDRLPDGKKTEFKIIDFWQNDFNKKADAKPPIDMPVLVSVFNTRLKIIERHLPDHTGEAFRQAVTDLRAMMARIPRLLPGEEGLAASGPGVGRRLLDAQHSGKTRLFSKDRPVVHLYRGWGDPDVLQVCFPL